jgi:DNA (cytosine-5)-methyltransferase 1
MTAFYNEIDPYAAQWLRNLIDAGHIAPGVVDERSIEDIAPNELAGYTQCHFFAGIGGWSLALRLAGWPDSRPVWTGSCPCQPFSAAGKGNGFADERHLWPAWQHIIAQRHPPVVFGEQVASKAVEPWIDLVHADVEGMGYAFGCAPYPAAGVGAPHIRDRNYWVADADSGAWHKGRAIVRGRLDGSNAITWAGLGSSSLPRGVANSNGRNAGTEREQCGGEHGQQPQNGGAMRMADTGSTGLPQRVGVARVPCVAPKADEREATFGGSVHATSHGSAGPTDGLWRNADWLLCRDGKWRPVEPSTFPLAHGVSGRVGRLRAYGNAIVPQQAAEFVQAYCEAVGINLGLMEQVA